LSRHAEQKGCTAVAGTSQLQASWMALAQKRWSCSGAISGRQRELVVAEGPLSDFDLSL
jgi:hypothetical protein